MEKRKLLELPEIKVTKSFLHKGTLLVKEKYSWNENYYRNKYNRLLVAEVFDDILKVSVFFSDDIKAGTYEPRYNIFIDVKEEKFITFATFTNKWRECKIDYLSTNETYCAWYSGENYSSDKTNAIVKEYIQIKEINAFESILQFQCRIKSIQLNRGHQNEIEYIDSYMAAVPREPSDLGQWLNDVALLDSRYIYYTYPETTGYCTHCGKTVNINGHKHNKSGICPNCHSHITYRAMKKAANHYHDTTHAFLLQKVSNGYVVRTYFVSKWYYKDKIDKPDFQFYEVERTFLTEYMAADKSFHWGDYKNTGKRRWCKGNYIIGSMWNTWSPESGKLYYINLRSVLQKSNLRYMPVNELLKRNKDVEFNIYYFLKKLDRHPYFEYLIKLKMDRLVFDMVSEKSGWNDLNINASKPTDFFDLSKEDINQLKIMNGGLKEINYMRQAKRNGLRLNNIEIKQLVDNNVYLDFIQYLKYVSFNKLLDYIKKHKQNTYQDYLRMRSDLGYDLNNLIFMFPNDLESEHEKMVLEANTREAELRMNEVKRKFPDIRNNFKKICKIYNFEDENFIIRPAKAAEEIVNEGRMLHHCVGGDSYLSKHNEGKSYILMLRTKDEPKKPYITVEIQNMEIRQWYGAYDKKPNQKNIDDFLKKYIKHLNKKVKKDERMVS